MGGLGHEYSPAETKISLVESRLVWIQRTVRRSSKRTAWHTERLPIAFELVADFTRPPVKPPPWSLN